MESDSANTDIYEKYATELIGLDSTFGDFTQLIDFVGCPQYNEMTSLMYSAISEQHVEFCDGRPSYFVIYQLFVSIGSAKDPTLDRGIASLSNGKIDFSECNIHSDYFFQHPLNVKIVECCDKQCNQNKEFINKGIWCLSCNGEFKHASQLKLFMRDTIKFTSIPRHSITHIEKISTKIDENDLECIKNVKNFLEQDKKKITILQSSIRGTEEKIKQIVEKLQTEKLYKQDILDKMLQLRGGSLDNYIHMLMDFDLKLITLSKTPEEE